MLNFSFYDIKRKKVRLKQAGRGGIGTVLRDKKIKAMVAHVKTIGGNRNNVVDMEAIKERAGSFNKEMRELDDKQCEMRTKGTAHLTNIMNDYDLLPVHNYKFGSHPDAIQDPWAKCGKRALPRVFPTDAGSVATWPAPKGSIITNSAQVLTKATR